MDQLLKQSEDPKIWDDPQQAQKLMKDISELKEELNLWNSLEKRISDTLELSQMDDPSLNDELAAETDKINHELNQLSLSTLLGGKYDKGNALLTINTG
ncbi:PCRF domain-containing protein, partial [bacterium]|nr:PCRF domain-containing protein [bacterium]